MTNKSNVKVMPYVSLHAHSAYSDYDGAGKPLDRAKRAKRLGQTALTISDHGTMSGVIDHYFACKEVGIKPILGIEAYHAVEFPPSDEMKRYHLTLMAETLDGYYNLCQASTEANLVNFYRKPIMTFETLQKYREGVICLSGCVLGCLPQTLLTDGFDAACRHAETFLNIYGDRFYFEVQPQEFDDQKRANDGILALADKFARPLVMTSDSHYVAPEDLDTYLVMRKMGYHPPKKNETELTDDMFELERDQWEEGIRQQYGKLYLPSGEELARRWYGLMGTDGSAYVLESQTIADRCVVELDFPELVPQASLELDASGNPIPSEKILARKVRQGLIEMGKWNYYETRTVTFGDTTMEEQYRPYVDRVKQELAVIVEKKYADYFLLVADMVDEARRKKIAVGPGRGSGVGSLVARAIGITEVDPVAQGCMFERFLQPSRMSLPDFDVDFDPYRRQEIFDYMMQKYNGRAAPICNINRLTKDSLINDLCKVLNIPDEIKLLMKKLIGALGIGKDNTIIPEYDKLARQPDLRKIDQTYSEVIKHFCKLYGGMRGYSQHASGLAISSGNLSQFVPLFVRGPKDARKTYTSYEMSALNKLNIVKIDILGLDAVTALQRMCKLTFVDYHDIPLDDHATFHAYQQLNVVGIFQFESPGAQAILKAVQPESISELTACNALNRPGSLELKQLDVYVDGKRGHIDMSTPLSQCCLDSYGALIYQEHVMQACRDIGDMSWASSIKVMKQLHGMNARTSPLAQEFIQGAMRKHHLSEQEAWELYTKLTGYTFNKGHAAAYSILSYWLMWMKVHFPFEFFLSILQLEGNDIKRKEIECDATRNKVVVLLPHVNGGENYEFVHIQGERAIRGGLRCVDGVGPVIAKSIGRDWKENGDFQSTDDMLRRVNGIDKKGGPGKSPVNSRALQALQNSGALEFNFEVYKSRCIAYLSSLNARKSARRFV